MVVPLIFALLLSVVLIFVAVLLLSVPFDLRLWPAIVRARKEMKMVLDNRGLRPTIIFKQGATRLNPRLLSIFILTTTDEERDRLRTDEGLVPELRVGLKEGGYPKEAVPLVRFIIESKENVDRNYGGRISEMMEMP